MAVFIPHGTNDRIGSRRHYGRLHVWGDEWGKYIGATDFWLSGASYGQLGSAGGSPVLADGGWTTTSMAQTVGSAADFGSLADIGTPNDTHTDAASDLVKSPVIFGDFMHMNAAAQILGFFPNYLQLEAWLTFGVASNGETGTGFGFFEDGGSPIVANDHLAEMVSDGTNFKLRSGAATSSAGPVVQTTPMGLRISIKRGSATSGMVGWQTRVAATSGWVAQGAIAREDDEFPVGFGFGQQAGGSNTIFLHWVHVWYTESGDFD